jgi:hypothetical protein
VVTVSKHRRVAPIDHKLRSFNQLSDASALLEKQKVTPTPESLARAQAQEPDQKDEQRLGQVIDILA